jgi:hypothetical protein
VFKKQFLVKLLALALRVRPTATRFTFKKKPTNFSSEKLKNPK